MRTAHHLHILHPGHPARKAPISPSPAPSGQVNVQLIFHTSNGLLIVDGNGTYNSDGTLDVTTSPFTAPDPGTMVQIVVSGPGGPIITEGTTGEAGGDGTLVIL